MSTVLLCCQSPGHTLTLAGAVSLSVDHPHGICCRHYSRQTVCHVMHSTRQWRDEQFTLRRGSEETNSLRCDETVKKQTVYVVTRQWRDTCYKSVCDIHCCMFVTSIVVLQPAVSINVTCCKCAADHYNNFYYYREHSEERKPSSLLNVLKREINIYFL